MSRFLLTVGAAVGVTSILVAIALPLLGIKPLIFRSGSMGPDIPTGSLALSRTVASSDLRVGDVVSVLDAEGVRVTHRLDAVSHEADGAVLVLRGDANPSPDAATHLVTEADRVFWSAPWLGRPIAAMSSTLGLVVFGASGIGLVIFAFRPTPGTLSDRPSKRTAAAAVSLAIAGSVGAQGMDTSATFTDTALTGFPTSTHALTTPQPDCKDVDGILSLGNIARLTWSQPNSKYEYTWELRRAGGTTVNSSGVVGTGTPAGGTVTLDINSGLIGTNDNYSVVVRARLSTASSWIATATTTTKVRRVSVLIVSAAMRCGWA